MKNHVRMRIISVVTSVVIILNLFSVTANADSQNIVSDWAKDEIAELQELLIFPETTFSGNLTIPLTRYEFAKYALYFLLAQYNMEYSDFFNSDYYTAYKDIHNLKDSGTPFSDVQDGFINLAYELGIISGYGDGTFRPDNPITRQEAAQLLLNVYCSYSDRPTAFTQVTFTDNVSDWASDAVSKMYEWNVMQGVGENLFDPNGNYTAEQSLLTFFRLYQNAPVSRSKSNITPLLSFDSSINEIENQMMFHIYDKLDLNDCCVIYGGTTGVPHGAINQLWIIYKTGGRRNVLTQEYNLQYTRANGFSGTLSDFETSPDGNAITFARTVGEVITLWKVDIDSAKLSPIIA
jgi:hypothetical protein